MSYYIGVDGGGTKTAFALFDESRKILCEIKGPGSNHENMEDSFIGASAVIWNGINSLCNVAGIKVEDVDFTLMGLAGIDHEYQHVEMCSLLKYKGLKNFEIFNDGYIVVKAGSKSGAGIGYNCGTGVCCNAIDSTGKRMQLAGLGPYSGDSCGGLWIAETVFRTIYDELFCCGPKTILTEKVMNRFSYKDREDFLTLIAKLDSEESDDYIRPLVDFLFEAVEAKDAIAIDICETMARRGAIYIAALAKQMEFDDEVIEVILSGSINVKLKNPTYLSMLKEEAQKRSEKPLKFIELNHAPVTGCVNWILQEFVNN